MYDGERLAAGDLPKGPFAQEKPDQVFRRRRRRNRQIPVQREEPPADLSFVLLRSQPGPHAQTGVDAAHRSRVGLAAEGEVDDAAFGGL